MCRATHTKRYEPILTTAVFCGPAADSTNCNHGFVYTWGLVDIKDIHLKIFTPTDGTYIAAGPVMMHSKTAKHYTFEICDRDERMKGPFSYAGRASGVTPSFLNEIDRHNFVIYLSGETGSLKEAENIARAGAALLNTGGLGIKVESAGKAFEKDKWLAKLQNFDEADLYDMFVIGAITHKDDSVFSCGMHILGLRDTIISGEISQL